MANLEFPNGNFTLHLGSPSADRGVRGTIELSTVAGVDWLTIDLGVRGRGSTRVNYTSSDERCGSIEQFDVVVVANNGWAETWKFDGILVTNPESLDDGVFLIAANVDVNGLSCSLVGVPKSGERPPVASMNVFRKRLGYVGYLDVKENVSGREIWFYPVSGPAVPVHPSKDRITWIHERAIYSGYRYAFFGAADCGFSEHGYVGSVVDFLKSEDEWEAKAAFPPIMPGDEDFDVNLFPGGVPTGRYRMVVTTPRNTALGMAWMGAKSGRLKLIESGAQFFVQIESGSASAVVVEAQYQSVSPNYGTITLPPFDVAGETWAIASITVFREANAICLFADHVQIGSQPAWISGFPEDFVPHRSRQLFVSQPTFTPGPPPLLGRLTNDDLTRGRFDNPSGSSSSLVQDLHWTFDGRDYYGFPVFLSVIHTGSAVQAELGYRGYHTPTRFKLRSDDDWEATATFPPQDDGGQPAKG